MNNLLKFLTQGNTAQHLPLMVNNRMDKLLTHDIKKTQQHWRALAPYSFNEEKVSP